MRREVTDLAYQGSWSDLLPILRDRPDLISVQSESQGYTPLHQAAWHGANLSVVGVMLALGADRRLRTHKGETPHEVGRRKHPDRYDLSFILNTQGRNLSQLMRKIIVDNDDLFGSYDGNQVVCSRLIECFCSDWSETTYDVLEGRLSAGFMAVTGAPLLASSAVTFQTGDCFGQATGVFWTQRFLPILKDLVAKSYTLPIEEKWAVISDLFEPRPTSWGLRGDMFLWMEMRQMLAHAEIPRQPEHLTRAISAAFFTLTGASLDDGDMVHVKHLPTGGMSGGMVSKEFWRDRFITMLIQRANWLRATWLSTQYVLLLKFPSNKH